MPEHVHVHASYELSEPGEARLASRTVTRDRPLSYCPSPRSASHGACGVHKLDPTGFLARRSGWNPPFGDAFERAVRALDPEPDDPADRGIDIGCVLEAGSFVVERDDDIRTLDIEVSGPDSALIYFVMRLMRQLQAVGSAAAIDYAAYVKSVPGTP